MTDFTTAARPYAKAVFELARDSGKFDDWSNRLAVLGAIVGHPDMQERLEAPSLTQEDAAKMVEMVASDVVNDNDSRNFIRLLAENDRMKMLGDISSLYEQLRAEAEGEIEANVVSAFDLTDAQRDKMAEALSRRLDRKVRIVSSVDKDLIGGAIIRAGDLVIDGSVKGRLEKMMQSVGT